MPAGRRLQKILTAFSLLGQGNDGIKSWKHLKDVILQGHKIYQSIDHISISRFLNTKHGNGLFAMLCAANGEYVDGH